MPNKVGGRMKYTEILKKNGVKNSEISARFGIPMRTLQNWARGDREPPEWVLKLLDIALANE